MHKLNQALLSSAPSMALGGVAAMVGASLISPLWVPVGGAIAALSAGAYLFAVSGD